MISKENAWAVLDAAASELKSLSYDELNSLAARLPGSPDSEWREWQEVTVGGQRLYIDILLGEWGLLRRRISVELVANTEDGALTPAVVLCVYFERYESGRLYEPRPAKRWEIALLNALPYLFLIALALTLFAAVWYLFLRSG